MIHLKSEEDLGMLRESGRILSGIMRELRDFVEEGVSTAQVDQFAAELMKRNGVRSAFKDYKGFPAHICTSINEEIIHGIPSARRLREGDILSIDAGINYQGYISDTAVTVGVGKIDAKYKKLIAVTREALNKGIRKVRCDNYLSDISYAIQTHVEQYGFSVVRDFVGHGVGYHLHEEPEIPNFGKPHQGPKLKIGMVFAIEPMVNMGTWETKILDNGWTAVTKDGLFSAHFEHTVAVTEQASEVLTN